MPFNPKFNGIWTSVIKPLMEELNHTCIRADDIFKPGSILNDIFTNIKGADYIIADVTEHNPNVYYELGYSHALEKKVILITQDVATLPFDLKHQRVISYSDTAQGANQLKNDLKQFIDNV